MAAAEQRDRRVVVARQRLQRLADDVEERPELVDLLVSEQLRHHAAEHAAVFQRVGHALCLAGAVRQHAPDAVAAAQQVGGIEKQVAVAPRAAQVAAGAQEIRIAVDQVGRDQAVGHQAPRPVEIGQDRFHQPGALCQPGFQRRELGGGQGQGDRIAAPVDRPLTGQDGGDALLLERVVQQTGPLCQDLMPQSEHCG